MKVLLVNGSPRKQGNTHLALQEVAKQLEKEGVESELVWIGNKPVHGCIACYKCVGGDRRCVFNDDLCNEVIEKMADCDGLIVGSPVYWGQPTGALLSLQQRMLFAAKPVFIGKPAAAVCLCRRGGATAAFQTLQMPFQMLNMPIVTSQYWNIAYGREEGQVAQDVEGLQTMRTLAVNMAWLLKKIKGIKTTDAPEYEPWTPMHFVR